MNKPMTNQDFQDRLDKHNGKNQYRLIGDYINQKSPVSIQHVCGWTIDFNSSASALSSKVACPICDKHSRNMTTAAFIKRVQMKYGDEYVVLGEYKNSNEYISVLHKQCDSVLNVKPSQFLNMVCGCQQCSFQQQRKTHQQFVDQIKSISPSITILGEYFNSTTRIECCCNLCGNHWNPFAKDLVAGCRCPKCFTGREIVKGKNDMWTTAPERAIHLVNKDDGYIYGKHSMVILKFKCLQCGFETLKKPSDIFNQYGEYVCTCCGDGISYPEKFFHKLLDLLEVDYIYQMSKKNYSWCDNYRYDFYLTESDTIIELHGEQHYYDGHFNSSLKQIQENDQHKKELALANNVRNYIVIDCRESTVDYIKQSVLKTNLINLFNFDQINWNECGSFALSSYKTTAINLWNQGWSCNDIASDLRLCIETIRRYLREGTNLGMCDYNGKESYSRTQKSNGSSNGKRVMNLTTSDIYNSTADANAALGIRRDSHSIAMCCRGKRKTAFGYEWVYI